MKIEKIKLLNIDCMEYMAGLADNSFDLAIVDPPYGIKINFMNMGSRSTIRPDKRVWDINIPSPKYFIELFRVSKNQIIWGGNYFLLPANKCFFVWDKGGRLYNRSFAECEYAWASFDKPADMIKIHAYQPNRIHPTQKPVVLYDRLLRNYAKKNQRILDTHLGSGSSAIAAHYFGCEFVGCELDKEYYEAACKRVKKETQQLTLF